PPAPRLLPHLIDDALAMAVLDQLIVAAALLERDIREEHHQDHHRDDRDVVRHGQDLEKLLKPGDLTHWILDARLRLAMIDVTMPSGQCQLSALCRMGTASRRIGGALAARRGQRAK